MKKYLILPLLASVITMSSCSFIPDFFNPSEDSYYEQDETGINPKLNNGFDITPQGDDKTPHAAYSYMDAMDIITEAIIMHKNSVIVDFKFNNRLTADDFLSYYSELNLHAYAYPQKNYKLGTNVQNQFVIQYLNHRYTSGPFAGDYYPVASHYSRSSNKNKRVQDILNANQMIRLNAQKKRDANFNSFQIDLKNKGTIPVYNSEELWWIVSRGYKPSFPLKNSKVEAIYKAARDVLRQYVNDDMSDFEKMRAIYEWIVSENSYDWPATSDDSNGIDFVKNTAYYLEGIFEHHCAVCDSFSKTMVLLSGIEGIDVKRSFGYTNSSEPEGHAWNYGSPDKDGKYYLICPTWGQFDRTIDKREIGMCDYTAFLTSQKYFESQPNGLHFVEKIFDNTNKVQYTYSPSVLSLDKMPNNSKYDCHINSQDEIDYVLNEATKACDYKECSIQLEFANSFSNVNSMVSRALRNAGYPMNYQYACIDTKNPLSPNTYVIYLPAKK